MGAHQPTGNKLLSCIAPVFLPAVCAWVWDEHMVNAVAQLPAPHPTPALDWAAPAEDLCMLHSVMTQWLMSISKAILSL